MEPLVKEYLKNHSFQQLEDEHGVKARPSNDGRKFSLNYDQLMVKNGDPVAEQCRGLILQVRRFDALSMGDAWKCCVVGDVDVLAWPMDRFYNHGDTTCADVDWSDPDLRLYEKLDGTMMIIYWDPVADRWHAATRAVPEADLPICKDHIEIGDMTFSELFFKALRATREASENKVLDWEPSGFEQVVHLNKELTYVFELTSPWNRVVVKYDAPRVTLLAARHTLSGKEQSIESLRLQHVQRPKTWNFKTVAELVEFVNAADPAELEGAVACDSQFNRQKVKSKAWVLSSRAKDLVTVSRRRALEAIIQEKIGSILPLVETSIADELKLMVTNTSKYFDDIDSKFELFKSIAAGSRKEFALQVQASNEWTGVFFGLFEGKAPNSAKFAADLANQNRLSSSTLDMILSKIDNPRSA